MKEQYIEIQGIPSDIGDDSLEDKVIEMLAEAHIVATKSDIDDCHRLGKNGSTIVQFVNRKFCNVISEKKLIYTKILTSLNLVFSKICVSENLTSYNQRLAWKCRELKIAKKIHNGV